MAYYRSYRRKRFRTSTLIYLVTMVVIILLFGMLGYLYSQKERPQVINCSVIVNNVYTQSNTFEQRVSSVIKVNPIEYITSVDPKTKTLKNSPIKRPTVLYPPYSGDARYGGSQLITGLGGRNASAGIPLNGLPFKGIPEIHVDKLMTQPPSTGNTNTNTVVTCDPPSDPMVRQIPEPPITFLLLIGFIGIICTRRLK